MAAYAIIRRVIFANPKIRRVRLAEICFSDVQWAEQGSNLQPPQNDADGVPVNAPGTSSHGLRHDEGTARRCDDEIHHGVGLTHRAQASPIMSNSDPELWWMRLPVEGIAILGTHNRQVTTPYPRIR